MDFSPLIYLSFLKKGKMISNESSDDDDDEYETRFIATPLKHTKPKAKVVEIKNEYEWNKLVKPVPKKEAIKQASTPSRTTKKSHEIAPPSSVVSVNPFDAIETLDLADDLDEVNQ